jgi:hypothetical protein
MQKTTIGDPVKRELIERLRVLRSDIDYIIDHARINLTARVEEILRVLEHRELIGDDAVELDRATVRSMLEMLDGLKVKPKKGRLKDLKRVDALLDGLTSHIPQQP